MIYIPSADERPIYLAQVSPRERTKLKLMDAENEKKKGNLKKADQLYNEAIKEVEGDSSLDAQTIRQKATAGKRTISNIRRGKKVKEMGDRLKSLLNGVKKLVEDGKYDEAIKEAKAILGRGDIWLSAHKGYLRWALMSLCNAYFMRGLYKDKTARERGAGEEDYLKALAIYKLILSIEDPSYSINIEEQDEEIRDILKKMDKNRRLIDSSLSQKDTFVEIDEITGKQVTVGLTRNDKIAELHYCLADIYKQIGEYKEALKEYEIVFEQIPDESHRMHQKAKIGYAEALIYRAIDNIALNDIENATKDVEKAQAICKEFIIKNPHKATVLGRLLLTLAWSYAIQGKIAEREKKGTGKKYYLMAAAIYGYILDESFMNEINTNDAMKAAGIEAGLKDIFSVISTRRKNLLEKDTMKELVLTELDLMIYKANAIAGAKEYEWAIDEYNKILEKNPKSIDARIGKAECLKELKKFTEAMTEYDVTMDMIRQTDTNYPKNPDYLRARIGLAEVKIAYANELIKKGKIDDRDDALKHLNEAEKTCKIILSQKPESKTIAIRAVYALNWAIGLKARIAKITSREAERAELSKIVAINKTLLYGIDAVKSDRDIWDIVSQDNWLPTVLEFLDAEREKLISQQVLREVDSNIPDLRFKFAEALKQLERYDEALDEYDLVLKEHPNHREAKVGKAETELPLAKSLIREGKLNEARELTDDARRLVLDVLNQIMEKGGELPDNELNLTLRILLSLTWSFNLEADIAEAEGKEKTERLEDIYISFVILKVLLKGKGSLSDADLKQLLDATEKASKKYNFDMNGLLDFVGEHREKLIDKKFLAEMGIEEWIIVVNYIGNLVALERYDEAETEINEILEDLRVKASLREQDKALIVRLYASLGDIKCWHRRRYKEAINYYMLAIEFFEKIDKPDLETIDIIMSCHYGLGFAYMKLGKLDKSEAEYKIVLDYYSNIKVKSAKDKEMLVKAHLGLGDLYCYGKRKSKLAEDSYNAALNLVSNNPRLKAQALFGLGEVNRILKKDMEAGLKYYRQALDCIEGFKDSDSSKMKAKIYIGTAEIFSREREYREAFRYLEVGWTYIEQIDDKDLEKEEIIRRYRETERNIRREMLRNAGSVGYEYETESSSHKSSDGEETEYEAVTQSLSVNFPVASNANAKVKVSHSPDPGMIVDMPAKNLIDPYINPYWTPQYQQQINDALDVLSSEDRIPLLKVNNVTHLEAGVDSRYDINDKVTLRPSVNVGFHKMDSTVTRYQFKDYPDPESRTDKEYGSIYQSGMLGSSVALEISDPIPYKKIPYTITLEGGATYLRGNLPNGMYPLENYRIDNRIERNNDEIAGNEEWITNLEENIQMYPNSPDRPVWEETKAYLEERNQNLSSENDKLKDELDKVNTNSPLISWYTQALVSAAVPWPDDFRGFANNPVISLGVRHGEDPISMTYYGFWPLEEDAHKTHGLIGYNQDFYLGSGIVMPVSANYSIGTNREIGNYLNANVGLMFTSVSRKYGFTPEINFGYTNYQDEVNDSERVSVGVKIYFE